MSIRASIKEHIIILVVEKGLKEYIYTNKIQKKSDNFIHLKFKGKKKIH